MAHGFPGLVAGLSSPHREIQLDCATDIRIRLCAIPAPIDEVLACNAIPCLVKLLIHEDVRIQREIAWIFVNLLSGTEAQVQRIVDHQAIPTLVQLLYESFDDVVLENSAWALGNAVGNSVRHRDYVLSLGVTHLLVELVDNNIGKKALPNVSWALSNLMAGVPAPDSLHRKLALLAAARIFRDSENTDAIASACWTVSFVAAVECDREQATVDSNIVQDIVRLLS